MISSKISRSRAPSGCSWPLPSCRIPTVEVKPSSSARCATVERVLGIADAAAEHGIDVHVKFGVFGQQRQFLVENFQALLRNVVGLHVVNADLQVFEAGAIQALDAIGHQQVAVGDQAGEHAVLADARDDGVEFGMQQRLAAADGHRRGAHGAQPVNAPEHFLGRHRLREIVKFVAIRAGQIAAPYGNDVDQQRMAGRDEGLGELLQFAHPAMRRGDLFANFLVEMSRNPRGESAEITGSAPVCNIMPH